MRQPLCRIQLQGRDKIVFGVVRPSLLEQQQTTRRIILGFARVSTDRFVEIGKRLVWSTLDVKVQTTLIVPVGDTQPTTGLRPALASIHSRESLLAEWLTDISIG